MAEILHDAFNYRLGAVLNTMCHCLQADDWSLEKKKKSNLTLKGLFASNPPEMKRMDKGPEGAVSMCFSPVKPASGK